MDNAAPGYRYPSIEMKQSPNNKIWLIIGFLILFALADFLFKGNQSSLRLPSSTPVPTPTVVQQTASPRGALTLGKRTKSSDCISVNGLPDQGCTPGDIDPKVTQDDIQQTICVRGYTKTVRPPVSYTEPLKLKIMQEYGDSDSPKDYELDHLVPLEIGGNPSSEANLWPEPYDIAYNAHEKDKVENYLHEQVCLGKISLQQAQLEIAKDWEEVYKSLP